MEQSPEAGQVLQPGQLIRPKTTLEQAKNLVLELYGMTVTYIKELNSYDDKNFLVKVSDEHSNPHVDKVLPSGYILKILNSMDSHKAHVDAEHEAEHLCHAAGILCPLPVLDLKGRDYSKQILQDSSNNNDAQDTTGIKHIVRMLTFIPGKIFVDVPYKPDLLYDCGRYLARFRKAIEGFSHPALIGHGSIWNLLSVPKLKQFLFAVEDEERKRLVSQVMDEFSETVIPRLPELNKGVIHGDFNEQNIIVEPTEDTKSFPENEQNYRVAGIIDFGDMSESYFVFDLAISIMYMMVESKVVDPLTAGGYVLAGYLSQSTLNDAEWDILKTCIAGRYCQSLIMGAYSYSMDPGNEYLLVTAANGWSQLQKLWATPKEQLYESWKATLNSYKK